MSGAELIAAERQRQVETEGWTAEHDAAHRADDLARAAVCYATPPADRTIHTRNMSRSMGAPDDRGDRFAQYPQGWPWSPDDWKPTNDRVRELVKAGALIAAEIDRLTAVRDD